MPDLCSRTVSGAALDAGSVSGPTWFGIMPAYGWQARAGRHCRRSWQQHLAMRPLPNPAVYVINSTLHEPLASAIAGKNCSTSLQEAIRWVVWGRWKTAAG